MAATPTVYVICDQNCKFEGMTKEQILTAIAQAVETGTIGDLDTGFITTIKTINGTPLKFFVGEQAEYDALTAEEKEGLFAIITNDATKDGLLEDIEELQTNYKTLSEGLADGSFVVAKAKDAENAENAETAETAEIANKLKNDEKTYTETSNEIELEAGKVYIITATVGTTAANEIDTFVLYAPKDLTNISFIYSATTTEGYRARLFHDTVGSADKWILSFENSDGVTATATNIAVREI